VRTLDSDLVRRPLVSRELQWNERRVRLPLELSRDARKRRRPKEENEPESGFVLVDGLNRGYVRPETQSDGGDW
jgi:hypothetical protein